MNNIQKSFANKRGLLHAASGYVPTTGEKAMLGRFDARMSAYNPSPPAAASNPMTVTNTQPTLTPAESALHSVENKQAKLSAVEGMSEIDRATYFRGDPNAPTSNQLGAVSDARGVLANSLRGRVAEGFADGMVPETADQLMARMSREHGAPTGEHPEPSREEPKQQAPEPKPKKQGGLLGAFGLLRDRSAQLNKAAGFARGMSPVHQGPGIVHGPGGPRDDKVNAKLSNGEAVLPERTVAALGGPEEVAELIERTNGKAPTRGLRGGQDVHAAWGWVENGVDAVTDAIAAMRERFNGIPAATQDFAPKQPVGEIPEPTYRPSNTPPVKAPGIDYDIPPSLRKPLEVIKEYDLNSPKDFDRWTGGTSGVGPAAPVTPGVQGVQSQAINPRTVASAGVPGAIRTAAGAGLGAAMGAANKYTTMPLIGGDEAEVSNRNTFYKDKNVSDSDKLVNGLRDSIDIGLPAIGGSAGVMAGSGVMSVPMGMGGALVGSLAADGIQQAIGDSPLDRYNRKKAAEKYEVEKAKYQALNERSVKQGHLPNGNTNQDLTGEKSIRPDILPARVTPEARAKIMDAALNKADVNQLSERIGPEVTNQVGLRQLTRDTMGANAKIPEGANFAFNQDGTPQMRWSGTSDEAAKTLQRGNVKAGTVKDGGGIVSINRGNGKFDNVALGETQYRGKDGTMGAWDKTQQFEDGTKRAAADKAQLAELQYQNNKFNAESPSITDPNARAAGLRGLAQYNTETENGVKLATARLAGMTAAETARHNRATEGQAATAEARTQKGQENMQSNNERDAFNTRFDKLLEQANTSKDKDGKPVVDQNGVNRMRTNIGKRVDLKKMSVQDLNSGFSDMAAEHKVAEALYTSAENRPTLAKARDWVNGVKPEVGGNTAMKIRNAKGGKDGDWTDVGLWDAPVANRKVIEIGGHTRELDEIIAPNGMLDRPAYDVVIRHLKKQGASDAEIKKLNKQYGVK